MTILFNFVLYDLLSERVVHSFFGPNRRYACKQVDLFFQKNSDLDKKDFKLFDFGQVAFADNYEDLQSAEEVKFDE